MQGPHQEAQKSRITIPPLSTVDWKLSLVIVVVAIAHYRGLAGWSQVGIRGAKLKLALAKPHIFVLGLI